MNLINSARLSAVVFLFSAALFAVRGMAQESVYPTLIHPSCVEYLDSQDRALTWEECSEIAKGVPFAPALWHVEGHRIGPVGTRGGYDAYYSYGILGQFEPGFSVVSISWSGGGTGHFSEIKVLAGLDRPPEPEGLIEWVWGRHFGDRCNGGLVSDKKVNAREIEIRQWITPFDVISLDDHRDWRQVAYANLFDGDSAQVKSEGRVQLAPYDDLANCANCCVGTARYRLDVGDAIWGGGDYSPKLVSVELNFNSGIGIPVKLEDRSKPLEYCLYDLLLREYRDPSLESGAVIAGETYSDFLDRYYETCVAR